MPNPMVAMVGGSVGSAVIQNNVQQEIVPDDRYRS